MPTFQSIGIHPELRSRLVTESNTQGTAPVETPQALLSRNPNSLRLLDRQTGAPKRITSAQVDNLREEVSFALIAQSRTGKWIKRVKTNHNHTHTTNDDQAQAEDQQQQQQQQQQLIAGGTVSAFDLVNYSNNNNRKRPPPLSTGCVALDKMLSMPEEYYYATINGEGEVPPCGVPFGHVTQFSGPPGSGKTQVVLQLIASSQSQSSQSLPVWYLCSDPSLQCYAQRLGQLTSNNKSVLDNVKFVSVTSAYHVLSTLADMEDGLMEEQTNNDTDTDDNTDTSSAAAGLLIIDSVSGCLSAHDSTPLQRVALTLGRLARQYNLAVVLTNGSTSTTHTSTSNNNSNSSNNNMNTKKPALGKVWMSSAVDIHVWMMMMDQQQTNTNRVIQATVTKHPAKQSSSAVATFQITDKGIEPVKSSAGPPPPPPPCEL
jgi:RecA/RadA recombinase